MSAQELGTGRLSWPSAERVGDRYGTVILMADGDSLTTPSRYVNPPTEELEGKYGTLVAEVLETRESTHIGDFFRGLHPETPEVGERITLGTGTFFAESTSWGATCMGLQPDDDRDTDWLDPNALYRAHEQTVRLTFVAEQDAEPECDGRCVDSADLGVPGYGIAYPDPDCSLHGRAS